MSCILPDHNELKLGINSSKSERKYIHSWKPTNTLPSDNWVKEEIKKETENFLEFNKM